MNKTCGSVVVVICCSLLGPPLAAALEIVKDGKPACAIVVADEGTHWDAMGAGWVQQYVAKATGAKLPIVQEKDKPEGNLISIGHTKMAAGAGLTTDDLKYDGCKMVVRGRVLYLIGRDTKGLVQTMPGYGVGARGTLRAATRFLEDFLDVRWFLPVPQGMRIAQTKNVSVPDDLATTFSPAFAYAHGRYIYGGGPAGIANNFRTSALIRSYGGHSYYSWVPQQKYFQSNPDYFAMIQGKRVGAGNHLCTSNPGVRELFKKGLFAEFRKGYEWVACGQTDGYRRCQCPKCEAMDNFRGAMRRPGETWDEWFQRMRDNPCERLHLTHKWLIDQAAKQYPDRKVHLLAYGPTITPSRKFDYYGDNVVIEICGNGDPRFVKLWKGKASGLTVYVVWFDITVGYGLDQGYTPAQASRHLRFLHDAGVIGIYFGGGGGNWGFFGPTYYVIGRMLGDPSLDYRQLVREYCQGLYGNAARQMGDFFDLLYSRVSLKQVEGASVADMQLLRYPPALLERLGELLDEARTRARTDRARNFIRLTRDHYDYDNLLTRALWAYRTYKLSPTEANWQATRQAVERFDAFRERILRYEDAYTAQWFPGHGKFCNYLTSRNSGAVYYSSWKSRRQEVLAKPIRGTVIGYGGNAVRYPLTLDFRKRPTRGNTVAVPAAKPPKLDGVIDPAEWGGAERQLIRPMLAAQPSVPTWFRMMYDQRALYIAFECDEPAIDKLAAQTAGRDGPIWAMDCGEILLAPDRSRRRYYHWIIAPAENALYDDRTGFKTLDDQDASWNGPIEYGFKVDKQAKRWFLEVAIPFTTLQTTAPRPGDWWLGNFGRERQTVKKREAPDLFLWSQEESSGFVDPRAFGKITFGN